MLVMEYFLHCVITTFTQVNYMITSSTNLPLEYLFSNCYSDVGSKNAMTLNGGLFSPALEAQMNNAVGGNYDCSTFIKKHVSVIVRCIFVLNLIIDIYLHV